MKNHNHDFLIFFPLRLMKRKKNLCKNHEINYLSTKEVQLDLINQKCIGIYINTN